jgi:hypothetical protein
MRRILGIAAAAVAGLTAAGLAVAALGDPSIAKIAPSATLKVSDSATTRCAGADGEYTASEFVATGRIATGPLAGEAELELLWVKNTKENLGFAEGTLAVRNADDEQKVRADVVGAVSGSTMRGTLAGYVGVEEDSRLVGTVSIARSGDSLAVKVGSGTLAGAALVFSGEPCVPPKTATGVLTEVDVEAGLIVVETVEGMLVIEITEQQAASLGADVGDEVTVTYREDEQGATLVKLERR